MGFHALVESLNPTKMELKGLLQGLMPAFQLQCMPSKIDRDSTNIIHILNNACPLYINLSTQGRYWLKKFENPLIRHTFREENKLAHSMAREGDKDASTSL